MRLIRSRQRSSIASFSFHYEEEQRMKLRTLRSAAASALLLLLSYSSMNHSPSNGSIPTAASAFTVTTTTIPARTRFPITTNASASTGGGGSGDGSTTARHVSTVPNSNEDGTAQQQQPKASKSKSKSKTVANSGSRPKQQKAKQKPSPLFDVEHIDPSASTYKVRDMSSFQEFRNVKRDGVREEDESGTDPSQKVYNVDYIDNDDDEGDNPWEGQDEWLEEWNASPLNNANEAQVEDQYYTRDEDDILTEREDRLYVDESGHRRKVETCVLVGVEDLTAMRKDRHRVIHGSDGVDDTSDLTVSSSSQMESYFPEAEEVYFSLEESMTEMRELIKTSGLEIVGEVTQRLNQVNPRTYIGTGKVKEAKDMLEALGACTVVFDAELTPGQQKALENSFNKEIIQNDFLGSEMGEIKVIDRTALILDIFAQHAKTREGKLQVDLALHEYRKPRLTRMWTHLERQSGAGGVGLRGPGESQLEIDKRLLRDRIIVLKQKIDSVQKQRDMHRRGRTRMGLPILALVGYTNAGKSTLLNYLTRAGVMAENILFATLDPTTRKVKLPGYKTHPEVLLTDTVGFIQKLPTQLVAAFRATLEEVREADVLIHISDVSNPVWHKQESAVRTVLQEIGAGDKPIVRVLNKIDLLDEDVAEDLKYEAAMMPGHAVAVSSLTGDGMEDFVATVEESLMDLLVPIEVVIPYSHGKEVNMVQEVGHVESIDYQEDGTYIQARVTEALANRLRPFYVSGDDEETINSSPNTHASDEEEIDWVAIGRGRHVKKNHDDL